MLNSQDRLVKLESLLDRVQRNRQSLSNRRKSQGVSEESPLSPEPFEAIEHEAAALAEQSISDQRAAPIDLVPKNHESIPPNEFPETSGEHIIDENSRIVPANSEAAMITEVDEFDGADVEEILSVAPDNVVPSGVSDVPLDPIDMEDGTALDAESSGMIVTDSIAPDEDIMELDADEFLEEADEEESEINIVPTLQPPQKSTYQFDEAQPNTVETAPQETELAEGVAVQTAEPLPLVEETASNLQEGELELIEDDEEEMVEDFEEEDLTSVSPPQVASSDEMSYAEERVPLAAAENPPGAHSIPLAQPQPAPERRVFDSPVNASGNVATIHGAGPTPVLWTIDAVLERAWKVGTKE